MRYFLLLMCICGVVLLGCREGESSDVQEKDAAGAKQAKVTGLFDFRNNKLYRTVVLGDREWMAENLNFPTENSWCYRDSVEYCDMYGRLYSWGDALKVCPEGWRLPNDDDWEDLQKIAADDPMSRNNQYYAKMSGSKRVRGSRRDGTRLKSTEGWRMAVDTPKGSDELGFSALPGGKRNSDGTYEDFRSYAFFWSASEVDSVYASIWNLWYNGTGFYGSLGKVKSRMENNSDGDSVGPKKNAYSVRCVRSSAP